MSHSQLEQLITMANQIADNNTHHDSEEDSVRFIAHHIKSFWARSMKHELIEYAQNDGSQLNALALKATLELAAQYA